MQKIWQRQLLHCQQRQRIDGPHLSDHVMLSRPAYQTKLLNSDETS